MEEQQAAEDQPPTIIHVVHLTELGPRVVPVPLKLEALQQLVDGDIEGLGLSKDIHLVCNESGALDELPVSWIINDEPIHGRCFLSKIGTIDDDTDYIGFLPLEAITMAAELARIEPGPPWHVTFVQMNVRASGEKNR